ncbi:MAG: GntR family transcriptional regulator [Clostridiales bacterium]|nr:GntR family transcriptional regulator [Clostridiales bacterium]
MIVIDSRGRVPVYIQIKNQIMELIVLDVLKPHDQIPSIRNLARDLSLNFNTVKRAYAELENDKVIYSIVGKGTFVAVNAMDNKEIYNRAIKELKISIKSARANGLKKEQIDKIVEDLYISFNKEGD